MRVEHARAFGRVAVLYGGVSPERDVSLDSGAAVHAALVSRGVDAELFDPAERALAELASAGFDRAWNALHGGAGEDGRLQGALSILGVPYTGSGVLGSALAMDKIRSKQLLAASGVAVPTSLALRRGEPIPGAVTFPVFVKPVSGGSSLGAAPVHEARELESALEKAWAQDDTALIEPLLPGPEYTVGVLAGRALPSIRIEAAGRFYDYDAKYVDDDTRFECPALADGDPLAAALATAALRSFEVLGCSGWGRADLMLDSAGVPQVLEVNTVPGMTSHSLVPCAAAAAGIDFPELCWRVLQTSFAQEVTLGG
ncbi:MAG: D-alanine--D-alanine ligase [Pseudomonadota bacterium]